MLQFIIIFTLASLANVMLNTAKTIIMYRNDKLSSSLINAITYGLYTYVVVLMAGDMALWLKMLITAVTNFIGVWCSMLILDRLRKDKVWEIKMTVREDLSNEVCDLLEAAQISHSVTECADNHRVVCAYCDTQAQSLAVKEILAGRAIRYFVSESKSL